MIRIGFPHIGMLIGVTIAFLLAATISCGTPTSAATKDLFQDCIDKHSMEYAWAECGSEEIARQEKRLAVAWNRSLRCFDVAIAEEKQSKSALVEDQRLWEKWKNGACGVYDNYDYYGQMYRVTAKTCVINILKSRIKFLQDFANPEYGSCSHTSEPRK